LPPTIRHDRKMAVFILDRFSGCQRVNAGKFIFIFYCANLNDLLQNKKKEKELQLDFSQFQLIKITTCSKGNSTLLEYSEPKRL
ncbi:MAG: hypothetical protein ACXVBP_15415, partial [Flavisolibacter sp.]